VKVDQGFDVVDELMLDSSTEKAKFSSGIQMSKESRHDEWVLQHENENNALIDSILRRSRQPIVNVQRHAYTSIVDEALKQMLTSLSLAAAPSSSTSSQTRRV